MAPTYPIFPAKSGLPSMLGIVPETVPAIEAHTHELLDHLSAHFRVR